MLMTVISIVFALLVVGFLCNMIQLVPGVNPFFKSMATGLIVLIAIYLILGAFGLTPHRLF